MSLSRPLKVETTSAILKLNMTQIVVTAGASAAEDRINIIDCLSYRAITYLQPAWNLIVIGGLKMRD